jgi:hypothetical protein
MSINNIKHSIWSLLFSAIGLILCSIGLIVMIASIDIIWIILFSLLCLVFLFYFLYCLSNIEWFKIDSNKILVRNIFSVIKEVEYQNIKGAFITNVMIFSIKMLGIRRPYLVLSTVKSLIKANVEDAYNSKKHKYIVIRYNVKIEQLIKDNYKIATGNDLIVK